ncbi:hypothetical protein ACF09I_34380 [Streptomyces sp. NPDC014940]|uniref:hypothetical protein n=1 Tax=Streptomyces sp. NPDC014940 TaxID=3364932 RepID=UPI0036FB39A8
MTAPLAVNTADGTCWTRRGALRGGEALYAPAGVCSCPEYVMATLAELAEHGIVGSADVLPVPVATYPAALPWARQMDADDLEGFLADLADAAAGDDDLATLAEVESAIARWRVIGEAQHAHNTAPGPGRLAEADVTPQVRKLRALLAGQRAQTGGVQ